MNNSVIVGQIGCGYWGPNLLRNLVANSQCEVKWCADISQERQNYVNKLYPAVKTTGEFMHILNDDEVEAVVIATPALSHYQLAEDAIKAGKHVLVEKPMTTLLEEVEKIGKLANDNNLLAMAGHTFLYNTAVRYLKQLIDSGELGEIRYIYSQRLNLGRIRTDVDVLWNLATHDVSIIQYLLNNQMPISVSKRGMAYMQDCIDDLVFLNIVYPGNVMANIHVSWLDPHKIRKMTVVGSKKMVVYDDIDDNKIAIFDKGIDLETNLGNQMDSHNFGAFAFRHRSGDIIFPKVEYQEPLKLEIEHFLDCILNGTECLTGVEHAKKVIRILSLDSMGNQ